MATYRNSLRSKQMLRQAFIDLLAERDVEKITVAEITRRADLSRNTFYAHYQDVYAILEEIQAEYLDSLNAYIDEAIKNDEIEDPLPLLKRVIDFINSERATAKVLIGKREAPVFIDKLRHVFLERIVLKIDQVPLRDRDGFMTFADFMAYGIVGLIQEYLRDELSLTADEFCERIDAIYLAGYKLYR